MDEDLWHVRMAPDDVKQLTLEQLDDLFRLEVIEADTLIWQPGMTEWLPLSVVAGLGDEDPNPVNIAVSQPPPAQNRMAQTSTAWPPAAAPNRMAQTATAWPPVAAPVSTRPLPPPSAPPPRSLSPAPVSAQRPSGYSNPPRPAPVPTSWSSPPPRPVPVSPYASTVAEPQYAAAPSPSFAPRPDPFAIPSPPRSIAPMATTQRLDRRSGGGGWLVFVAFAAGVAVTLYRNDLVHAAALSVGQETTYLKLETALGGPGFGTPRAVAQMAAATASLATDTPSLPVAPLATTTSDTSAASAPTTTATTAMPAPSSPPETTPPSATQPATATTTPATKPAAATRPVSDTPRASAPRAVSHAAAAQDDVDPVFKTPKKGKKARGSEYDPLNPSL